MSTVYDDESPESRPLLRSDTESQTVENKPTPLPKLQFATLCSVRIADPIAYSQIFPYINEMIYFLQLTDDPAQIGFYSGLVETAFALAQFLAIYPWAMLSDVYGRVPVIIIGTFGVSVATLFFGFSRSLTEMLVVRFFGGLFGGMIAVIHSVVAELTDASNQAVAFPIYGLVWPLGNIIGPLIGGLLSNPADRFPRLFDYGVLRAYPYILPCIISGIMSLGAVLLAYFYLEETLPSRRSRNPEKPRSASTSRSSSLDTLTPDRPAKPKPPPTSFWDLTSIPIIRTLIISNSIMSFNSTAFDIVFVLYCYTPIEDGGLSFSASQIGISLAIAGFAAAFISIAFMPTVLRVFPIPSVYNFFIAFWPPTFMALPLLNAIARSTLLGREGRGVLLWTGVVGVLACSRVGWMAFSVNMILVKDSAPTPEVLGATNGLVQGAMYFFRAIAPAFISSAFALSIEGNLLGGHLWAVVMVCTSLVGCSMGRKITSGT